MRRLIINADDFGLTAGVNRAIAEAHCKGIVSSATLMANAPGFEDAVKLGSQLPKLSIGCHVILVDGTPVLAPSQVSTLVTTHDSGETQFHAILGSFIRRALTGRLDPTQIEAEAVAQIRKLQASGIAVTHLDTHKHTHMFPVVYRALLQAAKKCGIGALRNPFSPRVSLSVRALRDSPRLWKRHLQVRALRQLERGFVQAVAETGMTTTGGCFGVVATGALDFTLFKSIVESIPEGTWEFVCHPGYVDSELKRIKTRLRESRLEELRVLTTPQAREVLDRQGIHLISYRDLAIMSQDSPTT
jgi:hopanoid biosynthesis associated protein HpnK